MTNSLVSLLSDAFLGGSITVTEDKSRIEFDFRFRAHGLREEIVFSTSPDTAMSIMGILQKHQAIHGFPIPQKFRPTGQPQLVVVESDEP